MNTSLCKNSNIYRYMLVCKCRFNMNTVKDIDWNQHKQVDQVQYNKCFCILDDVWKKQKLIIKQRMKKTIFVVVESCL